MRKKRFQKENEKKYEISNKIEEFEKIIKNNKNINEKESDYE